MKQMELEIDRLSIKGRGLSKGSKIEVISALPHEKVRVTAKSGRKKQATSLQELILPSLHRVPSRCAHHPLCGGCSIQHLSYEAQLEEKQKWIELYFAGTKVEPILPCGSIWQYRNKMEYSFSQDKEGNRYLGLMIAGSRGKVLNLTECHLSPDWFQKVLDLTRAWWESSSLLAYTPHRDHGSLRTLTLREGKNTGEKMVILTVSGRPEFALSKQDLEQFKNCLVEAFPELSIFLKIQQTAKGQPTQFFEMLLHGKDHINEVLHIQGKAYTFKISPSSFFQPNTLQAELLFTKALEIVQGPIENGLDLFCGTATLGCIFASKVQKMTGVELNPYAVYDARVNQESNNIANLEVHQGDVYQFLSSNTLPNIDLVILDPPRTGLGIKACQEVLKVRPKQLLYISCNPKTQAEDIVHFQAGGYQLKTIQPVDQFPHTMHIENIVLMEVFLD